MMAIENRKKITAAIAAVTAYLQYEQEGGAMAGFAEEPATVPAVPVRMWGISGRQAQMQNRTLMQMRAFK